ncbi:MAG: hypothetical protein SPI30_05040 [Prevotella sp.]|nr:hypothetical protein [Prevotella sp.]
MSTEYKVTEFFCMADDFCKLFDAMTAKYTIKSNPHCSYHCGSTTPKTEVMLMMVLFQDSGYRCLKHFYLFAESTNEGERKGWKDENSR